MVKNEQNFVTFSVFLQRIVLYQAENLGSQF